MTLSVRARVEDGPRDGDAERLKEIGPAVHMTAMTARGHARGGEPHRPGYGLFSLFWGRRVDIMH
jgi:hypothetical protein